MCSHTPIDAGSWPELASAFDQVCADRCWIQNLTQSRGDGEAWSLAPRLCALASLRLEVLGRRTIAKNSLKNAEIMQEV